MNLIVIEDHAVNFFAQALKVENDFPNGEWRHFKFKNQNEVYGLYQASQSETKDWASFQAHPEFFTYFLGLFKPQALSPFDMIEEKTFLDFCLRLNKILSDGHSILDLSVNSKWIWFKQENSKVCLSPKLQSYLDLV